MSCHHWAHSLLESEFTIIFERIKFLLGMRISSSKLVNLIEGIIERGSLVKDSVLIRRIIKDEIAGASTFRYVIKNRVSVERPKRVLSGALCGRHVACSLRS